jgi:hypothetical protein
MRDDFFHIIPDAGAERGTGSALTRVYRDIGLAAVAGALSLPAQDFEPEMIESLERGEFYLIPDDHALAPAEADA